MVMALFGHEPIDISSIYIGGGTPSLADPELLTRWISLLGSFTRYLPDYEFTIEANPESLTNEFARATFEGGVNRLIIGVQSFNSGSLRQLNRRQSTKDIYRAFYLARAAGYDNIGADLIFGLPGQRMSHLRTDIERLMALEPKHISFYQLTVEQGTPLARSVTSGTIDLPDDDRCAAMYQFGSHILIDRGYRRYEVSNFAREGYFSRHNFAYWTFAPFIALGPAAHGFVNGRRYANVADINQYVELIEKGLLPWTFVEEISPQQRLIEAIMLSLRTVDGIDKEKFLLRFDDAAEGIFQGETLKRYVESGHLIDAAGFVRLTDSGFLVADKIISDLVG